MIILSFLHRNNVHLYFHVVKNAANKSFRFEVKLRDMQFSISDMQVCKQEKDMIVVCTELTFDFCHEYCKDSRFREFKCLINFCLSHKSKFYYELTQKAWILILDKQISRELCASKISYKIWVIKQMGLYMFSIHIYILYLHSFI